MMSTLLTAGIIVFAVLLFIGLLKLLNNKAKRAKALKQETLFETLVWKNQLAIHLKEHINDYILAIDKLNFLLVYINFNQPKEEVVLIDLWKVQSAKLVTETTNFYAQKKEKAMLVEREIKKLQLEIVMKDTGQPLYSLDLYDLHQHGIQQLKLSRFRGQYWEALIQHCIKELPGDATVARTAEG